MSSTYSEGWRDAVRDGARSSAQALAPLIVDRFGPDTLIDVGAGEGWFAQALELQGIATTKVDGPWVDDVVPIDFDHPPYPELGRFDLALCLEVAEHVHEDHAGDLVCWLLNLAPTVVFSAAIPGQGGEGHVNEQWPTYWCDLFAQHGARGSGALRWAIWHDDRIEPWYRQNLLVFGELVGLPVDGCPAVVHPGLWAWKGHS